MTQYADRMKTHLAAYKTQRLGISEDGIWRGNEHAYPHILPEALQRLNVLETIRREFWHYFEANKSTIGLHTDFHHLNSSQAFGFNLFFPWVAPGGAPDVLFTALGITGRTMRSWEFEFMPDPSERTSVDFFATFDDGSRLLVEVKLTEAHFGASMPDVAHQTKLRDVYVPRLAANVHPSGLEEGNFFLNYQLFRNVSHLELARGDTLILLLPRANELTWAQGAAFRERYLAEHTQGAVRLVAVEDLVTELARSAKPRLVTHLHLLAEKYLPDMAQLS